MKRQSVEAVAKDWCMTIRGSQVIPVYPLTEDLQPGDVFLVQVPVDRQQELYRRRGFLPLDNHLDRLDPSGYQPFYDHSFLPTGATPSLPKEWIRPAGATAGSWSNAPGAAFPTYSFAVNSGAGLNLAIPVSGVPVGLSLLGSDAASGTISIRNSKTLGVDTLSLYQQLRGWATTNAAFLRHFGSGTASSSKTNFLRVITRVYATGKMSVTLKDAMSRAAGADVGVPKPVQLLEASLPTGTNATTSENVSNFTNAWNALSKVVEGAGVAAEKFAPGGSLRLAAASSRTVSLDETFDPPLIFGYLAFDCMILKGGLLGPPIPTHAVIDPSFNLRAIASSSPLYGPLLDISLYKLVQEAARGGGNPRAVEVKGRMDALERLVPPTYPTYTITRSTPDELVLERKEEPRGALSGFPAYEQFRTQREGSVTSLKRALERGSFQFVDGGSGAETVGDQSARRRELTDVAAYLEAQVARDGNDSGVADAITAVYSYYLDLLLK